MTAVYLHLAGDKLLISFDYNKYLNAQLKKIPGTRWVKEWSRWEAPISLYARLLDVLDDVKISNAVMNRLREQADLIRRVEELRKKDYHELLDYSPKIPLMSHQKKAFELHRMLKGSGNFGEMGSGKCKIGSTLVNCNGLLTKTEDIWLNNHEPLSELQDPTGGYWYSSKNELRVNTLDLKGKIVTRKVKKLFRQKVKEKVKKIITDDGNSIVITQAHKLYSIDTWTNTLEVGQQICVPKKLPHEKGELDLKLAELMGWMVGDGSDPNPAINRHRFTQKETRSLNYVRSLLEHVSGEADIVLNIKEIKERSGASRLDFCNKSFRELLVSYGYLWGKKSRTKEVPSLVMQANKVAVAAYLRGFFDAEAWVDTKKYQIEISSASELMMKQVNTLLRRFGMWLRVRKKRACATNGTGIYRDYWVGILGGESSRIYAREIGFFTDYKHSDLQGFLDIKPNSNVEGLPAYKILREIVDTTGLPIRHITNSYTIYLKGTQEPSREILQIFINNINKILSGRKRAELSNLPPIQTYSVLVSAYEETRSFKGVAKKLNAVGMLTKRGKPWHGPTVKTIITKGESFPYKDVYDNLNLEWLREKRNKLQQLIDQEVHYVKIESIEEIDYNGWVYDLEIDPDHNYIAENIICHNTASAICIAHWHLEMGNIDKVLVVCPKSVLRGWEEQIEMFSDLTYVSITGVKKEDRLKKLDLDRNINLINYEYTWRITDLLLAQNYGLVIADEAHRIKNPQSNQSKACYRLADAATYKIALTGTPVLNSSLDAFGIMRFIDPTVFGESWYSFRSRYFKNVGPENSPIKIFIAKHGTDEIISDKLYTRALRVLKEECMDLPTATHLPDRVVYLSTDQDRAYKNLQDQLCAQITETKSIKINHVLALMLKLNQITSGWIKDSETGEIIHFKSNPKFEELKNVVEEAGDQPIILWAYYKADMKLIIDYYGRCRKCKAPVNNINTEKCPDCHTVIKYRCSEVQGSTRHRNAEIAKFRLTTTERAALRNKFIEEGLTPPEVRSEIGDLLPDGSEPPQTNIFVAQCVAASEGLNLQRATCAIFYSRNWSLKDWTQALARNHRKGQTKKVTYINLVAKMANGDDTIDQRIVNALKAKEDLSKRVNKDDIKLLMGKFSKKDREAFKDVEVDDKNEGAPTDPEDDLNGSTDDKSDPEQKDLF